MKIFYLIILLTIPVFGFTQSAYLKCIEKGKFSKLEKKIDKSLEKNPSDIEFNYYKARLLMELDYKNYNPKQSYKIILDVKTLYQDIDDKEQKKLTKVPLDANIIDKYIDTVCFRALYDAIRLDTEEYYQDYLNYYSLASSKYLNSATENRNRVAFDNALKENSSEAFQQFMTKYPKAEQYASAKSKRNTLEFARVKTIDNIESYKAFITKYPDADELKLAWERIYEIAFEQADKINTAAAFKKYTQDYPNSNLHNKAYLIYEEKLFNETTNPSDLHSYQRFVERNPNNSWNTVALDSLFSNAKIIEDLESLKFCVDNMKGDKRKTSLIKYYESFTNDGETSTLNLFFKEYNEYLLVERKNADYKIAYKGDALYLNSPYNDNKYNQYEEYIKLSAPKERAFVAVQKIIYNDITKKNFQEALKKVDLFAEYFIKDTTKIYNLIELLKIKVDRSILINNIGENINSIVGGEYLPVLSADDKTLYFCGRSRTDNLGGEDIYVSNKFNGVWGKAKTVDGLANMNSNDAPLSTTVDGTIIVIFKDGNLCYSSKTIDGWSKIVEFPSQINSASWQCDAMFSSDGKALIYAAIKEENYDFSFSTNSYGYHGENEYPADIYVSIKDNNGNFGMPINLGPTINTIYCDRSPFLHPDMKTLYFSSSGHGGLGSLDVFKSTRLSDTCWNCWSEPINMGKEINTADSDWGYKISTDGEKAYFAKMRPDSEEYDIFWLKLPDKLRPDMVATVSGKLVDKDSNPVSAEILWEDLESGKTVGQSHSDPKNGSFFIVLPLGKIYGYYVNKDEYFPISNNVDLRNVKKQVIIEENIDMVTYEQMVEYGTSVPVNNLFFNFGESTLLPYSLPELKRVADIIKTNSLKVELSGHTDNIGNAEDNLILSEKRAIAVKDFLVNEGCPENLFTIVGFGMTKPVEKNNTESGRAKNRRVELKFVD